MSFLCFLILIIEFSVLVETLIRNIFSGRLSSNLLRKALLLVVISSGALLLDVTCIGILLIVVVICLGTLLFVVTCLAQELCG
jgi:uncharacterized membrane protein